VKNLKCPECSFETGYQGILAKHIFENHPEKWDEYVHKNAIALMNLMPENFDNLIIEKKDRDHLQLQNFIAGEYETIKVSRSFNQYGVAEYTIWIEQADEDNEIITPQSCHDCFKDCVFYKERACSRTEKEIEDEIAQWQNKIKMKGRYLTSEITIENIIFERNCYLDIPHSHLLKGKQMTLKTTDHTIIKPFLKIRDLFFVLY